MVPRSLRAAAIVALLALAAPAVAGDAVAPIASAKALPQSALDAGATVDAFHAALRRGDTGVASTLLADDALIFEEGQAERSKAEYAAHHLAADASFSQAVPSVTTRRTGGAAEELAWIATESRMKGSFRGTEVNRVMVETMVLRRAGGAWKIVHIHWSSAQSSVE